MWVVYDSKVRKVRVSVWDDDGEEYIGNLSRDYFESKVKLGDTFRYNININVQKVPKANLTSEDIQKLEKEVQ